MNGTCLYLGHDWGDWTWDGSSGETHYEKRECLRCTETEYKMDRPGFYGCGECKHTTGKYFPEPKTELDYLRHILNCLDDVRQYSYDRKNN